MPSGKFLWRWSLLNRMLGNGVLLSARNARSCFNDAVLEVGDRDDEVSLDSRVGYVDYSDFAGFRLTSIRGVCSTARGIDRRRRVAQRPQNESDPKVGRWKSSWRAEMQPQKSSPGRQTIGIQTREVADCRRKSVSNDDAWTDSKSNSRRRRRAQRRR